jgi:hypothetical protein
MMDRALMMGDSFNFTRVADGDDDDLKRRAMYAWPLSINVIICLMIHC